MSSLPTAGVSLVAQGVGQFIGEMGRAQKSVADFGSGVTGGAGQAVGAFGRIQSAAATLAPVVAGALAAAGLAAGKFALDAVGVAGDFEQTLNVLRVAGDATDAQMAAVSARATALGADLELPGTSAQDAASAMLELTRSGFSVEQSMEAARGALQLAAAGETDVANAAQITAGAINAFGLEASDAMRITDLLAGAANASQASMTDLAQGLQQGGFAFHAAGQNIDDLATSLAVLTSNNMTGSDSGTALKNAFMRLMDPTKEAAGLMREIGFSAYDANGNMKPLPQIIGELNTSLAGMTQEERNATLGTIFLSDGMKAMIPLLNLGEEGFNALKTEVTAEGQAAELAAAQMDGWNGAMQGFQSQIETLQLVIGQGLLPILTPLMQQLGATVGQFTAFAQSVLASENPLATLSAGISSFITNGTSQIVSGLTTWAQEFGQWVLDAMPGMGANLATFLQGLLTDIGAALPGIVEQLAQWGVAFVNWLIEAAPIFLSELGTFYASMYGFLIEKLPSIVATLAEWGARFVSWVVDALPKLIMTLGELVGEMLAFIVGKAPDVLTKLGEWGEQFRAWAPGALTKLGAALGDLWGKFTSWMRETAGKLSADGSIGRALIDGIKAGIRNALGGLIEAARSAVRAAISAAQNAGIIRSPSKAMADQVGFPLGEGIALGLTRAMPLITGAAGMAVGAAVVSPVALPSAGGVTNYYNNSGGNVSWNMPVYTNQSPAVLQQSVAVMNAFAAN